MDWNTGIIVDIGKYIYYFICEHERICNVFIFTKYFEIEMGKLVQYSLMIIVRALRLISIMSEISSMGGM